MAHPGDVISNPATGERVEFLQTRETTGGELLEFELALEPFGRVGGVPHQHPATETVDVLEGTLSCWYPGGRRDVGPGDSVVLPAGGSHYLFNDTPHRVRARVTSRPARDFETFFETVFALAERRQHKSFRGLPAPLHAVLLSYTYDVYAPLIPIAVQRPILRLLAGVARLRGYDTQPPA